MSGPRNCGAVTESASVPLVQSLGKLQVNRDMSARSGTEGTQSPHYELPPACVCAGACEGLITYLQIASQLIIRTFGPFSPFPMYRLGADLRKQSGTEGRDRTLTRAPSVPGQVRVPPGTSVRRLRTGRSPRPSGPRRGHSRVRDTVASVALTWGIPPSGLLASRQPTGSQGTVGTENLITRHAGKQSPAKAHRS